MPGPHIIIEEAIQTYVYTELSKNSMKYEQNLNLMFIFFFSYPYKRNAFLN